MTTWPTPQPTPVNCAMPEGKHFSQGRCSLRFQMGLSWEQVVESIQWRSRSWRTVLSTEYWVLSTACVKCRMWRSAPLFSHSTSLNQSSVWWKRPKKKDLIKLWWQSGCGHDIFWGIHDSWFWWLLHWLWWLPQWCQYDNDDDDDEKKLEAVGRPQALIQLHPLLFLLTLPSLEPSSGVFSIVFSS